jgi:hypothetical protein
MLAAARSSVRPQNDLVWQGDGIYRADGFTLATVVARRWFGDNTIPATGAKLFINLRKPDFFSHESAPASQTFFISMTTE